MQSKPLSQVLRGQVAVVTGAASGLGAAVAQRLFAHGADLVLNYRSQQGACGTLAAQAKAEGRTVVLMKGDVGQDEDCRALAQAAQAFGRVDVVVNNAGKTSHVADQGDLDALSADDFLSIYRTNVVGAWQVVRAVRPLMEAAYLATGESRPVVMVSSIAGLSGIGSSIAYAASKAALNCLTLSLARELAPQIRVNAVCPGFIDTPWFEKGVGPEKTAALRQTLQAGAPLRVASTADDIADTAVLLALPATRHMTGAALVVDAGVRLLGPA